MNWSLIILGLVALSSVAIAENSYLIIVPKLFKVGCENPLSIFIAAASQPVEVKYVLTLGPERLEGKTTVAAGETRNATLVLPMEFPVGAGEITIFGTGGLKFEDKRDVIVYDNRHVILVQTSASTYRPEDLMEIRVVVTNEELLPLETGEVLLEIYDAGLKLVGRFPNVPIRSGLTETLEFPISMNSNVGTWLVSATVGNRTSSLEVLVAAPVTPSFDLKAIFQRFCLRTEKFLRGIIEIDSDDNVPIFGRAIIAVGQITDADLKEMMMEQQKQPGTQKKREQTSTKNEKWRSWKTKELEIAGRVEINYDLMSTFGIDLNKALAIQVFVEVTDLASGQQRVIEHVIPIFNRDVVYDIHPLEFEAGIKNEFQVIAKRPDGKPNKMEDIIVTVTMMISDEAGKMRDEKTIEITDFYTRGRNDIALFNLDIPENCMGVLMTITPLGEDGKVRGYRTHSVPLMPTPRRAPSNGKLTIDLMPEMPTSTGAKSTEPIVTSQVSTVGRKSNFYIQLLPSKQLEKFEPLPMSYVVLTNGRITLTGQFNIIPTKECQSRTTREIKPEVQQPPICMFSGTLPIEITRSMVPYSTLLVYTFQPQYGFNVAETYRFSVGGLFQSTFGLNATVVPYTSTSNIPEDMDYNEGYESSEEMYSKSILISEKAQDKTRVQLSFTGTPGATVGLNVIEYDAVIQGLSGEVTKERVLQYLTAYEQVPIVGMPTKGKLTAETGHSTREMSDDTSVEGLTTEEATTEEVTTEVPSKKRHQLGKLKREESIRVSVDDMMDATTEKAMMEEKIQKPGQIFSRRGVVNEMMEKERMELEQTAFKLRYPLEKMVFGIESTHNQKQVDGDDFYSAPSMEQFYGSADSRLSGRPESHYRRKSMKRLNQYDVTVNDNDYVVATSVPLSWIADMRATEDLSEEEMKKMEEQRAKNEDSYDQPEDGSEKSRVHGSPSWFEKLNSRLSTISQEAFTFMQSGLSVVSDFEILGLPADMRRLNLTTMFSRYRQHSNMIDEEYFTDRDAARQVLEEYLAESGIPMGPPPVMLEEQARLGYYRSVFFNTSRIEAEGTGKVVLPRTKPYSTWLATGFALHSKSGLAIAQPIRLPTNQGLFILGNFPEQVLTGEQVLLTYGINNYLGKDLTNVIVRIRGCEEFDLIELKKPDIIASTSGKDYIITIPSLPALGVETRNITVVPKRAGVLKIVIEVESQFGGDYEVITSYARESGIDRRLRHTRLFDLTEEKKPAFPVEYKVETSPFLRSVRFSVSGTGLDRLIRRFSMETNNLIGLDRAIIRLWRNLGLRYYLNETAQLETPLDEAAEQNITMALQALQIFNNYDGSYSFISDEGVQESSFYLTTLSFGALISPWVPVRDYVTLNRTVSWLMSRQQEDGSFDDKGPCYHQRFCSGEYRRESLTALFLYTITRPAVVNYLPEFIRREWFDGEQSRVMLANRYLESRYEAVKSSLLTSVLIELVLTQSPYTTPAMKQKVWNMVRARQLTVMPEDGSKFWKKTDEMMTNDDVLLFNAITLSIYSNMGEPKTASQIARWIVKEIQTRPCYDTVLDAVFSTEAWIQTGLGFRRQYGKGKFSVNVEVSADNGEKMKFIIDESNLDYTQKFYFTLPVNKVSYTITGFGMVGVQIRSVYVEKQQTATTTPFQLTNEMTPAPWLNEIKAKTCVTYTPTMKMSTSDKFNRTIVVEFQLPTATRIDLRQLGFFLSRVENSMFYTYNENQRTLNFFWNVPSTFFGKPICFEWVFERLSFVAVWSPIHVRVFDYVEQETQLTRLLPVQIEPKLAGYSFVDAIIKARPSFEELVAMKKQQVKM